ncbi:MAG: hypothetical protein ACOCUU_02695 [Nanoarchaeota archaeon]
MRRQTRRLRSQIEMKAASLGLDLTKKSILLKTTLVVPKEKSDEKYPGVIALVNNEEGKELIEYGKVCCGHKFKSLPMAIRTAEDITLETFNYFNSKGISTKALYYYDK